MSLIETFDKLTSGKRVSKIIGENSETTAPPGGMLVAFAEDDVNADAWICHDENGVWLAGNAHRTSPNGYHGLQGFEEPLAMIKDVVVVDVD